MTGERVEDVRKRLLASVKNSLSPMKSIDANVRRGREALAKALAEKTTVHRSMFRNGLGWVDFVWGDTGTVKPSGKTRGGMGLSHILEARQRKDGMTEVESVALLDSIVNAIASGSEFSRQTFLNTTRVGLEKLGVIVWLTKRGGSNAWVVTGYEKTSSDTDAGRATSVPTRTLASLTRSDAAEVSGSIGDDELDVKFSANGGVEGFFDPVSGQTFLVADNLTAETAPGTLMHEVGIHMAAEQDGPMQKLITRAGKLRQKWANNKFVQEAEARMREAGETSDEEFLAYTVTQYENNRARMPVTLVSLAKDFIAAVKAWLFKKGYLQASKLTVADLAAIARANARKMARGPVNPGGGGGARRSVVQNNEAREFAATERAYGGREAYDRAKAAGKTKLNYRQWVQVRTPAFKAWFGDWEAVADLTLERATADKENTESSIAALAHRDLRNLETGIDAQINVRQADKLVSNAAVAKSMGNGFTREQHYALASNIEALWRHATLVSERDDSSGDKNIKAIKRFAVPVTMDGQTRYAAILAKESVEHGHRVYTLEVHGEKTLRGMLNALEQDRPVGQRAPTRSVNAIVTALEKKSTLPLFPKSSIPRPASRWWCITPPTTIFRCSMLGELAKTPMQMPAVQSGRKPLGWAHGSARRI